MSEFAKWARQLFGAGTPEHRFRAHVEKAGMVEIDIELKQPKGDMVVRYRPGTQICFGSEGYKYREFGPDEVILAKEIFYFGEGMSNGTTITDDYFKAQADPLEVTPLINITPPQKPPGLLE